VMHVLAGALLTTESGHLPTRIDSEFVLSEREFFIDNLVVRIHFIIVMIGWTGLAPWEFEIPFPGSRTSTFLSGFELRLTVVWLASCGAPPSAARVKGVEAR